MSHGRYLVKLFVLFSITTCLLLTACQVFGVYSSFHPFKSEKAKVKYLADYDRWAQKWPVPSTTKMIQTSFGQTFVRISGDLKAQPLVLLHGVGGNGLQFIPNAKDLSKKFCLVAVDSIWDNGRSIYSKPLRTSDDLVLWLDELLDGLVREVGLNGRFDLMGLSMGGWTASMYALKHPERLNKLVLAAPVYTVYDLNREWIKRAIAMGLCPTKKHFFDFSEWQTPDYKKKNPAALKEWVDNAYLAYRSFKNKKMISPTLLTDSQLASFKMPVLFLIGENEVIYPPAKVLERLHSVAPKIRTELIPSAGHDLTAVQSEMVDQLVVDFLK